MKFVKLVLIHILFALPLLGWSQLLPKPDSVYLFNWGRIRADLYPYTTDMRSKVFKLTKEELEMSVKMLPFIRTMDKKMPDTVSFELMRSGVNEPAQSIRIKNVIKNPSIMKGDSVMLKDMISRFKIGDRIYLQNIHADNISFIESIIINITDPKLPKPEDSGFATKKLVSCYLDWNGQYLQFIPASVADSIDWYKVINVSRSDLADFWNKDFKLLYNSLPQTVTAVKAGMVNAKGEGVTVFDNWQKDHSRFSNEWMKKMLIDSTQDQMLFFRISTRENGDFVGLFALGQEGAYLHPRTKEVAALVKPLQFRYKLDYIPDAKFVVRWGTMMFPLPKEIGSNLFMGATNMPLDEFKKNMDQEMVFELDGKPLRIVQYDLVFNRNESFNSVDKVFKMVNNGKPVTSEEPIRNFMSRLVAGDTVMLKNIEVEGSDQLYFAVFKLK